MSTQITLSNGGFQDAQGNTLANGTIVLQLSNDAVTNDASPEKQVVGNIPIVITLDSSGNVTGTPKIWSNAELAPSGTTYSVMAYTASGALAWRTTQNWLFNQSGGATVDLGTMTPTTSSGASYPGVIFTNPSADQTIASNNLILTTGAFICGSTTAGTSLGQDIGRFGAGGMRVQSQVANAETCFTLMPNGSSTESEFRIYNGSDPSNVGALDILVNGSTAALGSLTFGTGTAVTSLTCSIPFTSSASVSVIATSASGILPSTASGAQVVADASFTLGSGSAKAYGVVSAVRAQGDASGDRVYAGWFKATAQTNASSEVGLHAECQDATGIIAEFARAGSNKLTIDGNGNVVTSGTLNGLTVSTTTGTLSITNGKTLSISNTLVFAGTDSTTMTFPSTSATIARTDAANTFTGHQTIEGVTTTGATGTGNLVFSASPILTGTLTSSLISTKRIAAHAGTALVAGDFAASANWGTSPTITVVQGTDQAASVTIQAKATTGANPTLTLTFHDGTWTQVPVVVCSRTDTAAATGAPSTTVTNMWHVTSVSATQVVFTFVGQPVANSTYGLAFIAMGT